MSTTPLDVTIAARNLIDSQSLVLEVFAGTNDAEKIHWRRPLETSRHADVRFDPGGKDYTVKILAVRHDWEISVPTDFGNGPHRIRASTVDPVGSARIVAEHRFLIDDAAPQDIAVRAERGSKRTDVWVALRPGASGVSQVAVQADPAATDKPGPTLEAANTDGTDRRWSVRWPTARTLPEQMIVTVTTGAGRECQVTCDVQTHAVQSVGLLTGRVLEGALTQPGITVEVSKPGGQTFARFQTDQTGNYQFALSPGQYVVTVEKSSTGRRGQATVTVKDQATVTADLRLQR